MKNMQFSRLFYGLGLLAIVGISGCTAVAEASRPQFGSTLLSAVDDAYVSTDVSSQEDPQGLREKNFGAQDFMTVGYVNKVQAKEQVVVLGLTKFDLKPLQGLEVQSASLQLFALRADLAQPARLVDVTLAEGDWKEKELTFTNKPNWSGIPIAATAVYGGGVWYSWDVTGSVARPNGEQVSYVVGLRTVEEKKGEQVLFAAHEAGVSLSPRLIVTYTQQPAVTAYMWAGGLGGGGVLAALGFFGGWLWSKRRRLAAAPVSYEN